MAAVAIAAAVALGIVESVTQHQLNRAQAQIHSAAAVLAAPDARLTVRATTAGGTATVVSSQSRHAMIITTAGLPALGGGRVYEVWFLAPGRIQRAGLLPSQPPAGPAQCWPPGWPRATGSASPSSRPAAPGSRPPRPSWS